MDLAGQGKRETQCLPAVSSGRVASSLPNWERCPLHGLWTHWVYLCCLLKGTLCRLTWAGVPVSADGEAGSTASGGVGGFPAVLYLQALEAWYPSAGAQTGCLWTAYSPLHIFCALPAKQLCTGRASLGEDTVLTTALGGSCQGAWGQATVLQSPGRGAGQVKPCRLMTVVSCSHRQ